MLLRRLILLLFVLLQTVAPLLHAHACGMEHAGLHLPAQDAAGHAGAVVHATDADAAVTVACALEARDWLVPATPGVSLPKHGDANATALTWTLRPSRAVASRLFGHRLPLPCAPPRA